MILKTQPYSIENLLGDLLRSNTIDETEEKKIRSYLEEHPPTSLIPWYMKLIVIIGAWTGAIIFSLALGISRIINFESFSSTTIFGVLFISTAIFCYLGLAKSKNTTPTEASLKHVFWSQVALVLSVLGHLLLLIGITIKFHTPGIFVLSLALCIGLFKLVGDSLHRFLSCLLVPFTAITWIMDKNIPDLFHILVFIEVAILIFLVYKKIDDKTFKPLKYAMVFSILILFFILQLPWAHHEILMLPSNIIMIAVLTGVCLHAAKENGFKIPVADGIIVGGLMIVCLGLLSTPGIIASIALLIFAFHSRDNLLRAAGITFFPGFIFIFYYNMNMQLDEKSGIIAGTGLVLLGFREYLKRRFRVQMETMSEKNQSEGNE